MLWLDASLAGAAVRGSRARGRLPAASAALVPPPGDGRGSAALHESTSCALKGDHNVANSLAAAAAAAAVGVPVAAIVATLRAFPGVRHRLQVVDEIGGVTYVNDSKATNVDAALKALTAYHGPVFMILGGSLKGASFDDLAAGTEGRVEAGAADRPGGSAPRGGVRAARRRSAGTATPYVVLRGPAGGRRARPRPPPAGATSSSSAQPAPASTSTGTSNTGAKTSSSWWRS